MRLGLGECDESSGCRGRLTGKLGSRLWAGDELVEMDRVVGASGLFFQVVDVAVKPALQGRGLSKRIMPALMDEQHRRAPVGAAVTLLADGKAHRLYRQYGFLPSAPAAQGMLLRLRKQR